MKKRITFDEDYASWQVDGKYLQAGTYKLEFVTVGYNQLVSNDTLLVGFGDDGQYGYYYDISNFINTCKSLKLNNLIERYLQKSKPRNIDLNDCYYVNLTTYEIDKLKTVYRDDCFRTYKDGTVFNLFKVCFKIQDSLSPGIYECHIDLVDDIFTYVDIKNMILHMPHFDPDDWEVYLLLDEDV